MSMYGRWNTNVYVQGISTTDPTTTAKNTVTRSQMAVIKAGSQWNGNGKRKKEKACM